MTEAAKLELNNLTELQKPLYTPIDGKTIESRTFAPFVPVFYSAKIRVKSACSSQNNELIYTLDTSASQLLYTYRITHFPALRVKPGYKDLVEICWTPYPAVAPIITANFSAGKHIYSCDRIFSAFKNQYNTKDSDRYAQDIQTGNTIENCSWNTDIAAFKTNITDPWYYNYEMALAFPLFFLASTDKPTHRFTMCLELKNLVRMRLRVKNADGTYSEWKELESPVLNMLEGLNDKSKLDNPEIWSICNVLTDEEIKYYKCRGKYEQRYDDVVVADALQPTSFGSSTSIALQCSSPCKAVLFVAENLMSTKNNCHFNFSSNRELIGAKFSENPIATVEMKYGTVSRYPEMDSIHYSVLESKIHGASFPTEPGYHILSNSMKPFTMNTDNTVTYNNALNAMLIVKIADPSRSNGTEGTTIKDVKVEEIYKNGSVGSRDIDRGGPLFHLRGRLLVVRHLKFERSSLPNEKDKFNLTVT
jgi:hypothetical protein